MRCVHILPPLALCAVLLSSCTFASIEPPEVPRISGVACRVHAEQSGLVVGIEPFDDQARLETYFGTDVLATEGILPMFVSVENRGTGGFLLEKSRISLVHTWAAPTGRVVQEPTDQGALTLDSIGTEYGFDSPLDEALFFLSPLADAAQTQRARSVFEYNVREHLWLDRTVYPGGAHQGFVYFNVSEIGKGWGLAVRVEAQAMPAGDAVEFVLPFSVSPDRLPGGGK